VPFPLAWGWQQQLQRRLLAAPEGPDAVLLLEHEPCYTLGRGADPGFLGFDPNDPPAPLYRIDRGGEVTFHGPGQLVLYPVLNLQRHGADLHGYMRQLEGVVIDLLAELGLQGERIDGLTGVWLEGRKVAAIGVGTGAAGDRLGSLQRGTLAYPDTGASLVVPVGSLGEDGSGDGLRLQISGPGVPVGHSFLASDIEPSWVATRTEVVAGYPVGVDIYLVDGRGRIVCLPRSSSLGVLNTETDGKSTSEVH